MTEEIQIMKRNYNEAVNAIRNNTAVFSKQTIEAMHVDIMVLKKELEEAIDKQAEADAKRNAEITFEEQTIMSKRGQKYLYETYMPDGTVSERRSAKDTYRFAVIAQNDANHGTWCVAGYRSEYGAAQSIVGKQSHLSNYKIVETHEVTAKEAKAFRKESKE